jgi:tRNA pseudouridine65 synthase
VVRGYPGGEGTIDYPVRDEPCRAQRSARPRYRRLAIVEIDQSVGRYATSRYALVEVRLETGRRHQIRHHFKHIFHPLNGDTASGEGRHNRLFRERLGVRRLMLMALELGLTHPITG